MKTNNKFLFLVYFILIFVSMYKATAQKETYNWYFGDSAGVSFMPNGNNPHALTGSKIRQMEGSATISDKNGNVLFYSDGVYVWNKKHDFISNGGGLRGNYSSSRSVIIIPKPQSNRYYYIFTIDAFERSVVEKADTNGLRYSVIDALADNSNGAILQDEYNIKLLDGAVEKMITINHINKLDVWLVTYNRKNHSFYTYLIDKNGINTPTITKLNNSNNTSVEPINTLFNLDYDIKHSKLINCSRNNFSFELYDFNISTGEINTENALIIPAFNYEEPETNILYIPYSGVLSEDGNKFYGTCYRQRILQFDLTSNNINSIIESKIIIADSANGDGVFGAIRRGPDDKLYVASDMSEYLSVINQPNKLGIDCEFIQQGVYLDGAKSRLGLPIMMSYSIPPCDFSEYAGEDKTICIGENLPLGVNLIINNLDTTNLEFEWQPEIYLDDSKVLNPNCKPQKTTQYILKTTNKNSGCFDFDTVVVRVLPAPSIKKSSDRTTCKNSPVIIGNEQNLDEYLYSWYPEDYLRSTNTKTTYCKPEKNIIYYLTITNSEGCTSYDTIRVTLETLDDIKIIGDEFICDGDSTELKILGDYLSCQWNTGETSPNIIVKSSGIYSAEVVDNKGCVGDIFFEVKLFNNEAIEIIAPENICTGNTATLYLPDTYTSYLWSTGETSESIQINTAGTYWVTVTNSNNCQASDTVYISEKTIDFLAPSSIELEETCINSFAQKIFVLKNIGQDEIIISQMKLKSTASLFSINLADGADSASTDGIYVSTNIVLAPYTSQEFLLNFSSSTTGIFIDSLQIEIAEPCVAAIKIPISATATSSSLTFSSNDFIITPGEQIEIPIFLNLSSNSEMDYLEEIKFEYTYNPTLLNIENISGASIINKTTDVNNNTETLKISTFLDNNTSNSYNHTIKLFANTFLGNTNTTELEINNISSNISCLQTYNCKNTLSLSTCAVDLRPIKFFTPTTISPHQDASNTSNIICEIKTEETGNIILELRTASGSLIDKKFWHRSENNSETKKIIFDANNISSGIYFIILISEKNLISKKILLIK